MEVRDRGFSKYTRLDRALELISSEVKEIGSETVPFHESGGRVLAKKCKSKSDVPPFDRAAMDGYAIQAEDSFGADETNPKEVQVIDSIEIGVSPDVQISEGDAAKIATGAPMPEGADAVIMLEETQRENSKLKILAPVSPGKNVSSKGEDVRAGQKILEAGRRLHPWDVGMLASTGNTKVQVRKRPVVGVAVTGDELKKPGESLDSAQITEANSHALEVAINREGGTSARIGKIPDDIEAIEEALKENTHRDMLIFTGGTSVGARDLVPDAISNSGRLVFHGVSIRPGGPSAFGTVKGTPIFSLPGFPTAAHISFEMLVRPALRMMQGRPWNKIRTELNAELERKISSKLGRSDVVRVKVKSSEKGYRTEPIRVTGSSILSTMTEADGIVVVPEDKEGFSEGKVVKVGLLNRPVC
ncbi:hypothetical protein AKJ55_01870 [candidate division MSBL1 archaeon SCGC-AAA382M17]|uniref:MoaB/Mog domain-containing protein n=1 Tax=candidate division MSBL1 archaeon SCGC-AAA382M17 TaxID=1698284 RepID=A0ABR5TJB3_9EURY|nr:hypothetical protein AKJ55_01870 [candidate division MSBL1 archaeon SCGC-AAA382M17]